MFKALVPVDGSSHALSAVRHVIRRALDHEPVEIHLLNVQAPFHGDVSAFVGKGELQDFHREQGEASLAAAAALLDEAELRYTKHIFVGHPAKVIAQCAKNLECTEVIMGTHGYGTVTQLLLGSVSHEAIHQMDPHIAVTLVKGDSAHPTTKPAQ